MRRASGPRRRPARSPRTVAASLGGVSVSAPSFTLAPGEERDLTVNVASIPAAGSLYGALEVVGLPTDVATRKGVVLGYRVVSAIRLNPAAPKPARQRGHDQAGQGHGHAAGQEHRQHARRGRASGPRSRTRAARATSAPTIKILPGKTINFPLGTKLQKGSATAKITLRQKSKTVLTSTKKFKVK